MKSSEFDFQVVDFMQTGFPLLLETACHQAIGWVNLLVSVLRQTRCIASRI